MRTAAPVSMTSSGSRTGCEQAADGRRRRLHGLAGSKNQEIDAARLGQNAREIIGRQILNRLRAPGVDAGRKDEQRSRVRHAGKAKAAIAIGIDRRARRIVGLGRCQGLAFAGSCLVSRTEPKRISAGAATKTEE